MAITYRQATIEDLFEVFQVFLKSIMDYSDRMNVDGITGGSDPEKLKSLWEVRRPMFEFLANDASQFWVAESENKIIGYARAIEHDNVQELTEFFVDPKQQSTGVGGGLLSRALTESGAEYRTIIATFDQRALYRYMKMGLRGRFLLKYFSRKAEKVSLHTDLEIEPLDLNLHLADINRIDKELLVHKRDSIHRWIASNRSGFIYKRKNAIVGYGYIGASHGPFALLDENDFPAVLAHAESFVAETGGDFGASTPLINNKAIEYFLDRKYEIDSFSAILMSNKPFGKFENYLSFAPEFFL